jgi:archaellum component FlaC
MKTCASCGEELPESVDEFGDIDEPVCLSCFLNPAEITPDDDETIEDLENDINDLQSQVEGLREEIYDLEDQISEKRQGIRELRAEKVAVKESVINAEKQRMAAWVKGEPKKAFA